MTTDPSDLLLWPLLAKQRQVLETQWFTNQLGEIGPIQRLDEAIAAVQLTLTENAEVWPLLRGYQRLRLAKTRAVDNVPALNIWFTIGDDDTVLMLYVEPSPTD